MHVGVHSAVTEKMSPLEVTSEQVVRLGHVLWPGSRIQALLCREGTYLCCFSVTWGEVWLWPGRGAAGVPGQIGDLCLHCT